jgi:hypothetical protein
LIQISSTTTWRWFSWQKMLSKFSFVITAKMVSSKFKIFSIASGGALPACLLLDPELNSDDLEMNAFGPSKLYAKIFPDKKVDQSKEHCILIYSHLPHPFPH